MAIAVALHAQPDDEVVGTGGPLARSQPEGHRDVVVAATDGFADHPLDFTATVDRNAELQASAEVLGMHRSFTWARPKAVGGQELSSIRLLAHDCSLLTQEVG